MTDIAAPAPEDTGVDSAAVVITDHRVDPQEFMLADIDTSKAPLFSVGEVAKVFFARSAHWIRWVEREHKLLLDGKPVAQERTQEGSRKYTLSDVEKMCHALAQNKAINGAQLRRALAVVALEAEIYEYR